jgi:hypothetical protein
MGLLPLACWPPSSSKGLVLIEHYGSSPTTTLFWLASQGGCDSLGRFGVDRRLQWQVLNDNDTSLHGTGIFVQNHIKPCLPGTVASFAIHSNNVERTVWCRKPEDKK